MKKQEKAILLPKGFDLDKAYALQRLMADEQHKVAVEHIINDLAGTYQDPTDESEHFTYRNIGRAQVGRDMVAIYKLNLSKIMEMLNKEKKK